MIMHDGSSPNPDRLRAMARAMIHRGPDDEGIRIQGHVGLVSRRLSIIDLAGGHQPLSNEDDTIWTVHNGEIYNHDDLRSELMNRGHRFRTGTDTEILVHLFEEHGREFPAYLNGMFASALWDSRSGHVVIARDRLGIKPLYWAKTSRATVFASEIRPIMLSGEIKHAVDETQIVCMLNTGHSLAPFTAFKGIRKLPPGCRLVIDLPGKVKVERYWRLDIGCGNDEPLSVDGLESHFEKAVSERLMSDVPLGVFLSGGIDSSLVAAQAARLAGAKPIRTFTLGFAGMDDEVEDAARTAARLGADHSSWRITESDLVDNLPGIAKAFEEAPTPSFHTYFVSKLAANSVTVALTGLGGDELFSGYGRADRWRRFKWWYSLDPAAARVIEHSASAFSHSCGRLATAANRYAKHAWVNQTKGCEFYLRWMAAKRNWGFDGLVSQDLMSPQVLLNKSVYNDDVLAPFMNMENEDLLCAMELHCTLSEEFLNYTDRMSMAHSLEARVPFLDHELVEYVMKHPVKERVLPGNKTWLRRLGTRLLGDELSARSPKRPFHVPMAGWLRGGLKEPMLDLLTQSRMKRRGWFNPAAVQVLIDEHLISGIDHSRILWGLLAVELWHEHVLNPMLREDS